MEESFTEKWILLVEKEVKFTPGGGLLTLVHLGRLSVQAGYEGDEAGR